MKAKLLFSLFFLYALFSLQAQNLVAYYPFNGNANDVSGNLNHGTVNGATLTTDRFGNINSAYSFDGNNDYILCNTQVGPFGNDSRTVSFWAKTDVEPNSSTQQNSVLSYGQWPTGGGRFEVLLNPKCRGLGVDVSTNYITKEFDNSDNDWHFYTVVFDNTISNALSGLKFYGDGVLLTNTCNTNGNININTLDEQVLNIGRLFYLSQPRYFKGSIDEIKIYNKALTIDEINNEYLGLVAYYPFNGNANDESGNNHHGTTYNGVTLTQDKDGNPDSAYYFDGIDDYIDIDDWENGGAMSFTFWARWDAFNNYSRIIDLGNGSSSNNIIIANHQTNNGLFFSTYVSGETKLITANTITQSKWDFYAATFNINGLMTVYKNGSQINQKTDGIAPNLLLRTEQFIGKSNFSADGYFKGVIDELKIYNKTLTIEEIKNEANGLVAYYPFNGNAKDESGNNHNGVVYGPTLTTDRFGNLNSAYHYHGNANNDYIDIGDWENGGAMTINLWAKWEVFNNWGIIFDLSNGRNNDNIYIGNKSTTNTFMFHTLDGSTKYLFYCEDPAYPNRLLELNQWTMITCTVDEIGLMKAYKNGELIGTFNGFTPTRMVRTAQYFGSHTYPENGYFQGDLDDIRIYEAVLSEAEILNLYTYNTLKVDKIENIATSPFYVFNNTLYFKNTQNLNEIITIEVYNLLGQKVFETSEITEQIELNTLQKGMYVLKTENTLGNYLTLKFLIN